MFDVEQLVQYVVDLPEVRAHVLKILTERAWCPCCQKRVRSTHPRQVSKAGGAAAVSVGPRALVLAVELKQGIGEYLALAEDLKTSPLVATDDTGWRIARRSAWLWVFATDDITLYVIDYRRSADVVLDILGEKFPGKVLSDGLP